MKKSSKLKKGQQKVHTKASEKSNKNGDSLKMRKTTEDSPAPREEAAP